MTDNAINEMVRLDQPSRWDDLRKYMEDHRMDSALIASVGIDLGRTTFHYRFKTAFILIDLLHLLTSDEVLENSAESSHDFTVESARS